MSEAATRGVLYKEVFLEILQNSQENTCARVSFLMAQLFSCEFCKIYKNIFFIAHPRMTVSQLFLFFPFLKK